LIYGQQEKRYQTHLAEEVISMKKIFRLFNLAVLAAAFSIAGATAGFAQTDPCGDTAGQEATSNIVRENYAKTDLPSRRKLVEAGKQYTEKYGSCGSDAVKEFMAYLSPNLPKWEQKLKADEDLALKKPYIDRFNAGLKAKNWDEVYAAGKDLLDKWPDDFRSVEIALGTIGYDESVKKNPKYNDDTIKYAKMALADLQSGKEFKGFGVSPYDYKTKEDAIGYLNYYIGYITAVDKKDKKEANMYLYKASQTSSAAAKEPVIYELLGLYYIDEFNKVTEELDAKKAIVNSPDFSKQPEDVQKQQVDAVKAAVAQVNGAAERALDAYARAYRNTAADEKNKAYRDKIYKKLQEIYNVRFGKQEGLDTWIGTSASKPLANPSSPITPVFDPEPGNTAASASGAVTAPSASPATAKPASTTVPAKAETAAPTKTVAKPAGTSKPQAMVKKPAAKKKGA
jgi:Skp family chaperone for outer membrane proteins